MSLNVGSQLNLQKIPVLGLVAESQAAASPPATPVNGQLWYDTTNNLLKARENGAWVQLGNTGVELLANKGAASGYAPLNSSTKLATSYLETNVNNGVAGLNASGIVGTAQLGTGTASSTTILFGDQTYKTFLGTTSTTALAGNTPLNSVTAPTGSLSMNSQLITNLATPVSSTDAATKGYVDGMATGLDIKNSVRAASTANVSVTYTATGGTSGRGQITAAPNTLDGVTLAANNRILLKDQTTGAQKGIWVVTTVGTGANGVWDRATDFDQDAEVTPGAFMFVEEGTVNADTGWVLTTDGAITIGGASGTSLSFTQFTGAGSIVAGNGLTKTGNQLDIGAGTGITVNADDIQISATYAGQTSITTLGTITTGTWTGTTIAIANGGTGATTAAAARTNLGALGGYNATLGALTAGSESTITHNLGSTIVGAQFTLAGTGYEEILAWRVIDSNNIGVTADIAYSASAVKVFVWNK